MTATTPTRMRPTGAHAISAGRTLGRILAIGLLVVFAGFPVYWMINTSLSTNADLYGTGQTFLLDLTNVTGWWPMIEGVPLLLWLRNSAVIASGTALLSLFLALSAAYALSRFRFYGRGIVGFLFFSTQMLPEALIIVPLYALFAGYGLLNNHGGLILANVAFVMPVAVFILKGAIDKVPHEIEEAARIDGCSRGRILLSIVLPLVLPSIAAAAIIVFFDGWNEFLFANTFISNADLWPATVGLSSFLGEFFTPMNQVMLCAMLFALPAIAFFLWAQRGIVAGLTSGSVKG
ncbi:carbohydrate ABC transporter permease [Ruania rhizosphaerae]|uniref:carbohydrate ABC transporter permease n=1 Tax=Ruania rhizosphaerae TaxID=1840413 RepID=UPI00190F0BE8|nr:carbohydrate ABC transporter permease [Ruania rhizosphaerae]